MRSSLSSILVKSAFRNSTFLKTEKRGQGILILTWRKIILGNILNRLDIYPSMEPDRMYQQVLRVLSNVTAGSFSSL